MKAATAIKLIAAALRNFRIVGTSLPLINKTVGIFHLDCMFRGGKLTASICTLRRAIYQILSVVLWHYHSPVKSKIS